MPVALTDEQRNFRDAIRAFALRELGTRERRCELTAGFTRHHNEEIYRAMADNGWIGVGIPEQYGGSGGGTVEMCVLLEEATYGRVPFAGYGTSRIVAGPFERFGTEAQKHEVLTAIASGAVEAIAMSEPEAGSDVANIKTFADRRNGSFVVNGHKTWISNAHLAAHMLVVLRTTRTDNKHEGLTMLWVPTDAVGVEIRPIELMGGAEVNDIYLTDVEVPANALVGQVDQAWTQLMSGLNGERLILASVMLGLARRAFDDIVAYVKERRQFGRPIGSFQALRHRIADLAVEIEATKLLVYDVAATIDGDPRGMFPREASMAKLKATEVAKRTALEGMQMMGGYGYASEYDMEGAVRSALVSTIYGGTSEIQREIISKTYGL